MPYTVDLLRRQALEPTMVLLLDRVQKHTRATYGEIARVLPDQLGLTGAIIFPTHIGAVAGTLMDRIQSHYPLAPLLNLLVTNLDGFPGSGCFPYLDALWDAPEGTTERMPRSKRNCEIRKLWQKVYAFEDWDKVFRTIFGHAPHSASAIRLEEFKEQDGKPGEWGGRKGGESIHHKRLKNFILENPDRLGISCETVISKRIEQELLSGDSIDVFFATDLISYAIEVKSLISSDDDIKRGLYQCLKYRTVLAAQQETDPDEGSVVAKLVVERQPPSDLVELAKRLRVKIHVIDLRLPFAGCPTSRF